MPPPTSSLGLIERAQRGDGEAFAALFGQCRRRLAVLVHYRMGDELRGRVEVDDIVQEVFLRAFRDIGAFRYRAPGSFVSWLATIAGHVLADTARFHSRQQRHAEMVRFRSPSNPGGVEPADTRTPSRLLAQKQNMAALLARLDALPEEYRQAILLAKIEGLATAEMAERLGKPREAAALLLHRALKRFRSLAGSAP